MQLMYQPVYNGAMSASILQDQIHVWLLQPDTASSPSLLAACRELLSDDELARYRRFRFEHHARDYLLAHALARSSLSRYAGTTPGNWCFTSGEHGRPEIAGSNPQQLRFNITHTDGLVGCAITSASDCGLDAEKLVPRRMMPAVARRMFSAQDCRRLEALDESSQTDFFLSRWTLREAYVKARGIGISFPTRKLLFPHHRGGRFEIGFADDIDDHADNWQVELFYPTEQHVAALAVERRQKRDRKLVVRFADPASIQG